MPKEFDGVKYFTQEELNDTVGRVRAEGRDAGVKDFLKVVSFKDTTEAEQFISNARTEGERLRTENATLTGNLQTVTSERDTLAVETKKIALRDAATEVGREMDVSPKKALQIVALLGINAADFDPAKSTLKESFTTFLGEDDNKHFVGGAVTPETPGRKGPAAKSDGKPSKTDILRARAIASF